MSLAGIEFLWDGRSGRAVGWIAAAGNDRQRPDGPPCAGHAGRCLVDRKHLGNTANLDSAPEPLCLLHSLWVSSEPLAEKKNFDPRHCQEWLVWDLAEINARFCMGPQEDRCVVIKRLSTGLLIVPLRKHRLLSAVCCISLNHLSPAVAVSKPWTCT